MHKTPVLPYPANLPIAELRTAESFLVTVARLWAAPHRDPAGHHPDWRMGFYAAGIDEFGMPAFDSLFSLVTVAAARRFDIRCPRCSRLGADEGALLRLVSLLQYDRVCLATMILTDWLQPTAARMAMLPARGLAAALAHGGLAIPLRHGRGDIALSSPPPRVDPGFALVQ